MTLTVSHSKLTLLYILYGAYALDKMWFNKGDQNSLESGLKRPMGNELCRRLHPNDSRNPFSFTVAPQGVIFGEEDSAV